MQTIDPHDREALIMPLYRFNRTFWVTLVALIVVIAPGVIFYVRQLYFGLGVTDLTRPVFWGIYLVNFIFLIGVSMAGTLISAVLQLMNVHWRRPITRIAEALTVFGLMIAGLQIIVDMGRPDRVFFTFIYGRLQAPLMWDIASLTIYLLTAIFALYLQLLPDIALLRDNIPAQAPAWRKKIYSLLSLNWHGNFEQWRRLKKVITIVSVCIIPVGISLHTITSWLFSTTVQPGWKSTILGPYFVIGAIFSGIGLLFIVVSFARHFLHLRTYISLGFYNNLSWIFIIMSAVWFYFTGNEVLILTAEQETLEFPVMAAKLWGEFAPSFWIMVALMVAATWLLVMPKFLSASPKKASVLQPHVALASAITAAMLFTLVKLSPKVTALAALNTNSILLISWLIIGLLLLLSIASLTRWFKNHLVATTFIASTLVLVGMWLERWNIIIPTVTHARLIPYTIYNPTITEVFITISAAGIFVLLFVLFFKLFPAVSLWEIEEERRSNPGSSH